VLPVCADMLLELEEQSSPTSTKNPKRKYYVKLSTGIRQLNILSLESMAVFSSSSPRKVFTSPTNFHYFYFISYNSWEKVIRSIKKKLVTEKNSNNHSDYFQYLQPLFQLQTKPHTKHPTIKISKVNDMTMKTRRKIEDHLQVKQQGTSARLGLITT
jgi:hypothetical protein